VTRSTGPSGVRLFNTFEPVTDLYRELVPRIVSSGAPVTVYASRAEYRPGRSLPAFLAGLERARLRRLANLGLHARHGTLAKGVIGVAYFLDALARTLLAPGRHRNVFLTQPPFIPVLGLILSKLRSQPYCVILMDLQPQLAVAVGVLSRDSLAYRILHRVIGTALRNADRVVVIGRCMADTARREGIPEGRLRVIPNWADPDRIHPIPHSRNRFRREMGWGERFVVMYAGTLGYAQSLESLVAASEGLARDTGIVFVVIGEGVRRAALEERLARSGSTNVELHPFMHRRFELSEILSAADVHFVPLHPDVTGLAVPSKTYGILAAGRPFIFQGSERSEIARLARDEDVGIVVPPRAPDAIASAVRDLAGHPDRGRALGRRGRALCQRAWKDGGPAAAYEAVLAELDGTGRGSGPA